MWLCLSMWLCLFMWLCACRHLLLSRVAATTRGVVDVDVVDDFFDVDVDVVDDDANISSGAPPISFLLSICTFIFFNVKLKILLLYYYNY